MKENKRKLKSIDDLTNEVFGKRGTASREKFEYELRMNVLGAMIRDARKRKKMSQEELGILVGVQKAQISKIENNTKDFRLVTILRITEALGMKVRLTVTYDLEESHILS